MTWSPAQVEEEMIKLHHLIESGVANLRHYARRNAEFKAMHDIEMAKALAAAKSELRTEENPKPTVDEIKGHALQKVSEIMVAFTPEEVIDLHAAHELAELAYQTERDILTARREESGMLRTLLVQARQVQDSGR